MPTRNEEDFIGPCLDSLLATDYPVDRLEVLVVDGRSTDGTRDIVARYVERHPHIRLVDNPEQVTPSAMNRGIAIARGSVIVRLDAHSVYSSVYIRTLVESLEQYGADLVGGMMVTRPRSDTLLGRAIVAAITNRFGVGNSYFRTGVTTPRIVDTVFSGAYRKSILDRVGEFNERLQFSQDLEFNLRVKRAGGKVLLIPNVSCEYYARSDWESFSRHNYRNGLWVILPFRYSPSMPVGWKHLVPLAFVLGVLGSLIMALAWPAAGLTLFGLAVGTYLLCAIGASVAEARRAREPRLALLLPLVFLDLHLLYGIGSLVGVARLAAAMVTGHC